MTTIESSFRATGVPPILIAIARLDSRAPDEQCSRLAVGRRSSHAT
jgi:hypothetical protein